MGYDVRKLEEDSEELLLGWADLHECSVVMEGPIQAHFCAYEWKLLDLVEGLTCRRHCSLNKYPAYLLVKTGNRPIPIFGNLTLCS